MVQKAANWAARNGHTGLLNTIAVADAAIGAVAEALGGPGAFSPAGAAAGAFTVGGEASLVIGRGADLERAGGIGSSEFRFKWPDAPTTKANWKINAGLLRAEMRNMRIRDASPSNTGGWYLNAERGLLRERGWTFDANSSHMDASAMNMFSVPDRRSWQFSHAALNAFQFLAGRDFQLTRRSSTLVRFESRSVFVVVYHGRRSFEIGMEIGRRESHGLEEVSYSLSELLRLPDLRAGDAFRNPIGTSTSSVRDGLAVLASTFGSLLDSGVLDDSSLMRRLALLRH